MPFYAENSFVADLAQHHFRTGQTLERAGFTYEAATSYRCALALNPNIGDAWFNLGNILDNQGKFEEAVESYHQAILANPNDAEAHCNLALVLLLLGRWEEAWPEYEWRFYTKGWLSENLSSIMQLLIRIPHWRPMYTYRALPHFTLS